MWSYVKFVCGYIAEGASSIYSTGLEAGGEDREAQSCSKELDGSKAIN
jgi:hypothetical protein